MIEPGSPLRLLGLTLLAALWFAGGVGCSGGGTSSQASSCNAACSRCGSDFCVDCGAASARFRDEFETLLYARVLSDFRTSRGLPRQLSYQGCGDRTAFVEELRRQCAETRESA